MRALGPLVALFLIVGATVSGVAAEPFDLAQEGKIVRLSNPQISPDGRSVVIVVSRANYEENRYDVELVLVDVASRAQKVLSRRRVSSLRWQAASVVA